MAGAFGLDERAEETQPRVDAPPLALAPLDLVKDELAALRAYRRECLARELAFGGKEVPRKDQVEVSSRWTALGGPVVVSNVWMVRRGF